MNDLPIHFARLEFAHGIWLWACVVLALIWLERRGSDALDRLVGVAMQGKLVDRPSRWRRWARVALLSSSGFAMVVALMQPQFGLRYVATPRVGAEIMIALDVSRSMLADDAKPSRLERAKAEISDLLAYLDDDYVGLIAFAGRATVLSPMTPDKSFLRLALESAGPHSVTRGGTRLAEPIRRAVAGFGDQGPAQRALILITDGEDHDSFALDAARAASEAGIKIIAIGFGDEGGSPIDVVDSRTGARTRLRDGEGRAIVSRLDGDLLREIALVTDGAFVPAGTGVLDLASIYQAHIADLTRGQLDERGRSIRDEAYQFFVLLAILFLVAAVSISSGRQIGTAKVVPAVMMMLGFMLSSGEASAQTNSAAIDQAIDEEPGVKATAGGEGLASGSSVAAGGASSSSDENPRSMFNRANEKLAAGDPIAAATLFRDARRDATNDLQLRYAATYNLGMAAVARADNLATDNPPESLTALYEAADWFREAAAARPDAKDPRHNLDVTLRRALILSDEIGRGDEPEIAAAVDELIEAQRERVLQAATLLEEIFERGELDAAEVLRPAFRDAATQQRLTLTDANRLAERIEGEQQRLAAIPEADRTPEDVLTGAQYQAVLGHLDSGIDRMGKMRRQLRQRRAERAYRRGSRALADLKRARDQLRDPVDQLGILLSEVAGLAAATNALARTGLDGETASTRLPRALTGETVTTESQQIEARVSELATRFAQAAEQAARSVDQTTPSNPAEAVDPRAQAKEEAGRIALFEAAPEVGKAASAMTRASGAIAQRRYDVALGEESKAGDALASARERFFDLKQLLNAIYADEERIAVVAGSDEPEADRARSEHVDLLVALQVKNLDRSRRLEDLLDRERDDRIAELQAQAAETGSPGAAPSESEPTAIEIEAQRFEMATQRLALASGAMLEAADALGQSAGDAQALPDWAVVHQAAMRAVEQLDAIRTLFFTIAEHVRKLALDQVEVRDQTEEAVALAATDRPAEAPSGPGAPGNAETEARGAGTLARTIALAEEQSTLESRGGQIADALFVQAEELMSTEAGGAGPGPEDAEATQLRIRQAAEHVASAQLAMLDAGRLLADETAPLAPTPVAQTLAIEELRQALALLSPPPPPEPDSPQEEESNQDDAPSQEQSEPAGEPEKTEDKSMDDPSQLLQGVRDREAERRRGRDRDDQRRRAEPVDKDW